MVLHLKMRKSRTLPVFFSNTKVFKKIIQNTLTSFNLEIKRKKHFLNTVFFSKKKIDDIEICHIESNIAHNQEMLIDYKISSLSGAILSSGSMALEYVPVPEKFVLHSAYPNPFNPSTIIQFELDRVMDIELQVYDITGKIIKSFFK